MRWYTLLSTKNSDRARGPKPTYVGNGSTKQLYWPVMLLEIWRGGIKCWWGGGTENCNLSQVKERGLIHETEYSTFLGFFRTVFASLLFIKKFNRFFHNPILNFRVAVPRILQPIPTILTSKSQFFFFLFKTFCPPSRWTAAYKNGFTFFYVHFYFF